MVHTQMQVAHPRQIRSHKGLDVMQVAGSLLSDTFRVVDSTEYAAGRCGVGQAVGGRGP